MLSDRILRRVADRLTASTPRLRPLAAFALTMLIAGAATAQTKTGTTTMGFLHIEPSPRLAAQGNAGATARDGVMAGYYNPGGLGFIRSSSAEFAHSEWLADIDYNYAGVALRFTPSQTLALSVTQLSSGDMDVRTPDQPEGTGERFSVNDLAIGVGYGRQFTDRFAGGVQVKYVREQIWHTAASTLALDMGVIYEMPFRAVLGASLTNFGTRSRFSGRDLRIRFDQDPDTFGDNDNLPAALVTEEYALPGRDEYAGGGRRQQSTNALGRCLPAERQQQQHQPGGRVDLCGSHLGAGGLPESVPR